jgi:hypothetical protein
MSVDVELVFENEVSHLFHLIGLRFTADGLQVENFIHSLSMEDDVTATSLLAGGPATFQEMT